MSEEESPLALAARWIRSFVSNGSLMLEGQFFVFMKRNVEQRATIVNNKTNFFIATNQTMFYKNNMRKNASLPVRLEPEMSEQLDAVADRMHLNKSAVIRMLVEAFLNHAKENGGRIVVPPEFVEYEIKPKNTGKRGDK